MDLVHFGPKLFSGKGVFGQTFLTKYFQPKIFSAKYLWPNIFGQRFFRPNILAEKIKFKQISIF